jgi:ribulose-5-phosphate 4-epimerase/fuculose-1-phosphate aldolase
MIKDIINILQESYKKNWITPRDGNVSFKHSGSNEFIITPSGLRKQELKESDLVKVDILDFGWKQKNNFNLMPSGEIEMHYEILKPVDKEICVIHLHPPFTIAAMYSGINLSKLSSQFPELSRYTAVADNTKIVNPMTKDLALQCKQNLIFDEHNCRFKNSIVGIPNHGVVSIGKDIYEAFEHIERLEHISSIISYSRIKFK